MSARRRPTQSRPAYLLLGEDLYLRDLLREEILDDNVPADAREFAVARYALDRTPLEEVLRRATILPMFAPQQVLLLKNMDYVALAKISGASTARILFVHIFPGTINTLIIVATLQASAPLRGAYFRHRSGGDACDWRHIRCCSRFDGRLVRRLG